MVLENNSEELNDHSYYYYYYYLLLFFLENQLQLDLSMISLILSWTQREFPQFLLVADLINFKIV